MDVAAGLQKPIIPLKLDEVAWPPKGPDGNLLPQFSASEGRDPLLYIDFTKAEDRWKGGKFNELLRQLRRHLDVSVFVF